MEIVFSDVTDAAVSVDLPEEPTAAFGEVRGTIYLTWMVQNGNFRLERCRTGEQEAMQKSLEFGLLDSVYNKRWGRDDTSLREAVLFEDDMNAMMSVCGAFWILGYIAVSSALHYSLDSGKALSQRGLNRRGLYKATRYRVCRRVGLGWVLWLRWRELLCGTLWLIGHITRSRMYNRRNIWMCASIMCT